MHLKLTRHYKSTIHQFLKIFNIKHFKKEYLSEERTQRQRGETLGRRPCDRWSRNRSDAPTSQRAPRTTSSLGKLGVRHGMSSPSEPPEGTHPCQHPVFRCQTLEPWDHKCLLFSAAQLMVICYGSSRYSNSISINLADPGEAKAVIGKEAAATPISWEVGVLDILWLEQCSGSVCAQASLQSVLVPVLIHQGHRVALSRVDVLWNCLGSARGHKDPAVNARPAPGCQGLLPSFLGASKRNQSFFKSPIIPRLPPRRGYEKWPVVHFSLFFCLLKSYFYLSDCKIYVAFIPENTSVFGSEHTGNTFILWQMN